MIVKFFPLVVQRDWPWVSQTLGVKLCEDTKGIVAVDIGTNAPVAVCVLDSWSHTSVQAHIRVIRKMALRHGFLEEVANYVYGTCGKEIIIGVVPGNNEAALKLDKHIGFVEKHRVKDGFDHGVDYVIMEMRKDDCRYYQPAQEMREVH